MRTRQPKLPRICILQRSTPAIEAAPKAGGALAGRSTVLSEGAQLLVCGAGFDEHTVKVLWNGAYYFIYAQHLKKGMTHLSLEEWLEFAQGAASPEQARMLQAHLDGGCVECRRMSDIWREAFKLGQREAAFQPPQHVVQSVKSAFQGRKRWAWLPKLAEFARLVSDSTLQPAMVRSRGLMTSNRHLLHETEAFVIDVQIEDIPARKSTRITGQILSASGPGGQLSSMQIALLRGRHTLAAETTPNASGEFNLEYGLEEDRRNGMELFFDIQSHGVIGISLPA